MALSRFDTFARSVVGPSAAGAQVYLCLQPAVTSSIPPAPLASLYADPLGVTPISQPLVCDGFGHASCYVSSGTFTEVVVYGGQQVQVYPDQFIASTIAVQVNGLEVNGNPVTGPNFNNSTPSSPVGSSAVNWQFDGLGNVSGSVITSTFAPLASPALTGNPTAPTPSSSDNSTAIATTAYVQSALSGTGAVSSVFGRTGAILATAGDYTVADITGAAPKASPAFTGVPTAPTPATADNSTTIATTAYVKAQAFSGLWSGLQSATTNLTLSNAGYSTTFNQTSPTIWTWQNTTLATSLANVNSPIIALGGNYWTGAASGFDLWSIGTVSVGVGAGNSSTLLLHHTSTASLSIGTVAINDAAGMPKFQLKYNGVAEFEITGGIATNSPVDLNSFTRPISILGTAVIGTPGLTFTEGGGLTSTAGTQYGVTFGTDSIPMVFKPISGNANCVMAGVYANCNQTGTASGNFTGLLVSALGNNTSFLGTTLMTADFQNDAGSVFCVDGYGANLQGSEGFGGYLADSLGFGNPIKLATAGQVLTISGSTGKPVWTGGGEVYTTLTSALTANFNSGSAKTVFTPAVATQLLISYSQAIVIAASSSSTFPSLTLGWTDVGGIARTKTLVATSTTNTTAVESDGTAVVYTNSSTPVTITSASYASSGATSMEYTLALTVQAM